MFTGIVEELGRLESLDDGRLRIAATQVLDDVGVGDSIAVNGCCLTVVELGDGWWAADAVTETLDRTSLGALGADDGVNLERPVRVEDRLGGGPIDDIEHGAEEATVPGLRQHLEVAQVPTTLLTRGPIDTCTGPSHSCRSPSTM